MDVTIIKTWFTSGITNFFKIFSGKNRKFVGGHFFKPTDAGVIPLKLFAFYFHSRFYGQTK